MSANKFYPEQNPSHYAISEGMQVTRTTFRGCAVGILDHSDIQILEIIMVNTESEEHSEWIYELISKSKERMQNLHNVLGAFDVGNDGSPSKPDSERIDWDKFYQGGA